jgi:repressor LexA
MVLDVIGNTMKQRGYPPTIREIGEQLKIKSTNGVNDHLKALEKKGYIFRDKTKSRGLRLNHEQRKPTSRLPSQERPAHMSDQFVSVPLIGHIAAGSPILAEENHEAMFQIDAGLLGSRAATDSVFVLKVHGESMIGDGIYDGDLIFVERCHEAKQGEIVAVLIDGDATVKRFYRHGQTVYLEPSNEEMEPIVIDESDGRDTQIIGRVIGVFRRV